MLHILLLILKIILFLILAVVGLVLTAALAVLLIPVRYRAQASLEEEFQLRGRVSWLFRIFSLSFSYRSRPREGESGLKTEFRLFGVRLFNRRSQESAAEKPLQRDGSQKEHREEDRREKEREGRTEGRINRKFPEPETDMEPVTALEDKVQDASEEEWDRKEDVFPAPTEISFRTQTEEAAKSGKKEHQRMREQDERGKKESSGQDTFLKKLASLPGTFSKKIKRKAENFKSLWKRSREKLSELVRQKERLLAVLEDEKNRKTAGLIIRKGKKFIRRLMPEIKGHVTFGVEDPYLMGKILTVLAAFYPLYGKEFVLTPVFDENRLEGEVSLKGSLCFGSFAAFGARILLDRNFRRLLRQFLKEGGI